MRYLFPVETYDAIVPAGGTIDEPFAKLVGTSEKALIEIDGRKILDSVLSALRESGVIRNIAVVGSQAVQTLASKYDAAEVEPGQTGPDNIFRGLDKLHEMNSNMDRVLIVTCDLPFLTADIVRKYIELCPSTKDICVPVIEAAEFTQAYPNTTSTFVKTKDGTFTIGGMFLMNARKLPKLRASIERIFEKRKSKLGLAMLIGPTFVAKFLTHSLTIRDLERKIESMLGCTGAAVRGAPVELAYDIDYQDDYDYAVSLVGGAR